MIVTNNDPNFTAGLKVTLLDQRVLTSLAEIQQEEITRGAPINVRLICSIEQVNNQGVKELCVEYEEVQL